jgi:hypothetical protein
MVNQTDNWVGVFSLVCKNQRRMVEFILNENVQIRGKPKMEIIGQMGGVISPRKGKNLNWIALRSQILY